MLCYRLGLHDAVEEHKSTMFSDAKDEVMEALRGISKLIDQSFADYTDRALSIISGNFSSLWDASIDPKTKALRKALAAAVKAEKAKVVKLVESSSRQASS